MKRVYQRYWKEAFAAVTEEEIINNFIDIFRYASQYLNTEDVNWIGIWSKLTKIDKSNWDGALLFRRLCQCAPFGNASFEHFSVTWTLLKPV